MSGCRPASQHGNCSELVESVIIAAEIDVHVSPAIRPSVFVLSLYYTGPRHAGMAPLHHVATWLSERFSTVQVHVMLGTLQHVTACSRKDSRPDTKTVVELSH